MNDRERVEKWMKEHNYQEDRCDDPSKDPHHGHSCYNCYHGEIHWYNETVRCTLCCPKDCQWMWAEGVCDEWR